jgi:hypothetical protein
MAKTWSIALLLLLTLPMAAPATAPVPTGARWDSEPALRYRVPQGESLRSLAARAIAQPESLPMLASANGLGVNARLRAGQYVSIPSNMVRRELLKAVVTGFAGDVSLAPGVSVTLGSALTEGDVITVGANSYVTLEVAGTGRVTLPSQSRVRIKALHRVALTGAVVRALENLPADEPWLRLPGASEGQLLSVQDTTRGGASA